MEEIIRTNQDYAKMTLTELIQSIVVQKFKDKNFSKVYRRDLKNHSNAFLNYCSKGIGQRVLPKDFTKSEAQLYMDQFVSSWTYYNNVKRNMGALFQFGVDRGMLESNPFKKIPFKKQIEKKHVAFELEQMIKLLEFIDGLGRFKELRICANLVYSSLLRPHQEVRLLKRSDFNDDFTRISISGERTKNSKNRSVLIDQETTQLLLEIGVQELDSEINIWSRSVKPFNESYFNNQWRKMRELDKRMGEDPANPHSRILRSGQSLYSFRHTAAIMHYETHQSIAKLQRLMDHSSVQTTEKYLRDLGMLCTNDSQVPDKYELLKKRK